MYEKIADGFERWISRILIMAALIYITIEIVELFYRLYVSIAYEGLFNLEERKEHPFMQFVVIFFNVVIALEMIETLRIRQHSYTDKAKLILLIGMIAVARKLLHPDTLHAEFTTMLSIAALIASLSLGYFLLSRNAEK